MNADEICRCGAQLVVVETFQMTEEDAQSFVAGGVPRERFEDAVGTGSWWSWLRCPYGHDDGKFVRSTGP